MHVRPVVTPRRRAWLEQLSREGVATRTRGTDGYRCMVLGWTEWVWESLSTGERKTDSALRACMASERPYFQSWKIVGETITDAGRVALAATLAKLRLGCDQGVKEGVRLIT